MIDVINHIDTIEKQISELNAGQKGMFAAWCTDYLLSQPEIDSFLKENFKPVEIQLLKDSIQFCWIKKKFDNQNIIEELENLDSPNLEDDSSGTIELLCSVTSMVKGVLWNSAEYIANCAEHVLNFIDYDTYTSSFDLSDKRYQHAMLMEMNAQINMISLLKIGKIESNIKILR